MSTRCQIGFYAAMTDLETLKTTHKVLLYKHSDGYPRVTDEPNMGVIPLLLPFLKHFQATRGLEDYEYCSAWVMWHLITDHVKCLAEIRPNNEPRNCLSFGISDGIHGDIEYFYAVHPTGLNVYSVSSEAQFNLLESIEIK